MRVKRDSPEIGKVAAGVAIVVIVVLIGWFASNWMETPENRGLDGEAIFRAAEKHAKSNGVDIKTIPQWTGIYYKYHPEEKPGSAPTTPGTAPQTALPTAPPH
jgi:hypothetical protein